MYSIENLSLICEYISIASNRRWYIILTLQQLKFTILLIFTNSELNRNGRKNY